LPAQIKVSCALLVTTPDTLSVRAAAQKSRELYEAGANNVRLVVNNVPARVVPMKSYRDFDDIVDQTGAQLIAVIPASQRLHHSANNGAELSRESIVPEVFLRLAERLRGKQTPLLIR
jgi:septum formation inhibitor-activating ATPase MinD